MTDSTNTAAICIGSPFDASDADEAGTASQSKALEDVLRSAIADEQLRLHYQPVINLGTGRITGLEALLRWEHPKWGTLSPRRFIAAAEESELMVDIGDWMLRQACRDLRSWMDNGCTDIRVDLNLSPTQFCDPRLVKKIGSVLSEWRIEARMLCLEMTEAVLMRDAEFSKASLARLKGLGVALAVDDYGSGFLPIRHLNRFPLDRIKIGRLLVRDMMEEADDSAILKTIVSTARQSGMLVCAEGVENDIQCKLLREHLCDEMQGHLFYRALPAGSIVTQVREGKALADHLARLQTPQRTLLLVDDEINILAALKRLLRRDSYQILTANSGREALELLKQNEVDVIVSDQRMPGMTGTEFFQIAKDLYPDTMRIVLSGYTELQSVTDAVNQGSIYKFLTKPWDDAQLRGHIEEAFRRKEMADENQRLNLEVRTANQELAKANRQLEEVLNQKQQQIKLGEVSLGIVREALQHVPLPVIGLDDGEVVAFVNIAAESLFDTGGAVLGCDAAQVMPELVPAIRSTDEGESRTIELRGTCFQMTAHSMGKGSESRGKLLIFTVSSPRPETAS